MDTVTQGHVHYRVVYSVHVDLALQSGRWMLLSTDISSSMSCQVMLDVARQQR